MVKKIKKILVTGSSGTIGTYLCKKLFQLGYEVVGVDKVFNKWSKEVNAITIKGNLLHKSMFSKLPKDVDLIIHLAANARVYDLVVKPCLAFDNYSMLFNILEFSRENKIKRFMFASSREVYGNTDKVKYSEQDVRIDNCESPYTSSKMGGETLVHSYVKCYGIDAIITRFSNVYGMYDQSDRVIPLFIRLAKKNKDLIVFGERKSLDFTHIADCVDGVIKCVQKFDKVKNNTFNIASGKSESIVTVAKLLRSKMGKDVKIKIEDNRTGEVVKCNLNINKANKLLNFKPKIDIEKGINLSLRWYGK